MTPDEPSRSLPDTRIVAPKNREDPSHSLPDTRIVAPKDRRALTFEDRPTDAIINAVAVEKPQAIQPYTPNLIIPTSIRMATDIAYTALSAIVMLVIVLAIIVTLVWFVGDLTSINIHGKPPAGINSGQFVRDQVINATANFLANLALVLVLVEMLSSLVTYIRTRRASLRPLLLIPLFIVMRGIILIGNSLIVTAPNELNSQFFALLAKMGAFGLIGVFLSIGLAFVRDPQVRQGRSKHQQTDITEG